MKEEFSTLTEDRLFGVTCNRQQASMEAGQHPWNLYIMAPTMEAALASALSMETYMQGDVILIVEQQYVVAGKTQN